jgi:pimeloyl-ACP methyl ester carboxylesterase
MKMWKNRVLVFVGILSAVYLAACLYIWGNQVEMIFLPEATIPTTPKRMGMEYEEVRIPVASGLESTTLHGFWVPSPIADAPAMLYLHGNEATIGKNLEHTQRLHQLGYHVLLVDYRGFGESFGTTQPSETKAYEDAVIAWDYLIEEKGINPSRAFIFGHSLGGAVAIQLAIRRPQAAGLITECTFTSILDMSARKYGGGLRLLPMDLLLHQRFESISNIGELDMPVLLIHGTADTKIPSTMTEDLYAAAPEPKELLLIEGGGHANSGSIGWVDYKEKISEFVGQHCQPAEVGGVDATPPLSLRRGVSGE